MTHKEPIIFEYLNYRDYLKDYCAFQKKVNKNFSHRYFLRLGNIPASDASILGKTIKGVKNLSQSYRIKFANSLKLNGKQTNYFEFLVQFNQAKTLEEKNYFFKMISSFRGSKAAIVQASQGKFYSKWYYPVVRAFIGLKKEKVNPNIIAKNIRPSISSAQAKEAIEVLLELKLIKKLANDYKLTDEQISTENEVSDMYAHQYIQELIQLAFTMFDQVDYRERHYYSNVFTISKSGFKELKERLMNFEQEHRSFIANDKNEEHVYTLNYQLFPNTF